MAAQWKAGRLSRVSVLALAALTGVAVVACDSGSSTPRPSASLLEVEFTPRPGTPAPSSEEPTEEPTFISMPVGWDSGFCNVLADVNDAQELVIDIERALAELNPRDARLLARDLRDVTAHAATLLDGVPEWAPAEVAMVEMASLVDLGGRAGTEYGTFFADDSRTALRRARTLRREIQTETPQANQALDQLTEIGIECPGLTLQLEVPQPVQ